MARPETFDSAADRELAALAGTGDRAAFSELVRRHSGLVRAQLRRMGAQPTVADDIAQDAWIIAYERIGSFRGEGGFTGWIKQIAARLYLRRWRAEARYDLMAETPEDVDAGPDLGDLRDLDAALQTLPKAERLCVSLCSGAGFSHAEAADLLQTPIGTVKSHVKRGLDRLRRHLGAAREDGTARSGGDG
ncbi:RNA polymerase sigma factor [soil metagenome]